MNHKNDRIIAFAAYEDQSIGIVNITSYLKIKGTAENIERLIAFALQSGMDVDGLTESEHENLLALEIEL